MWGGAGRGAEVILEVQTALHGPVQQTPATRPPYRATPPPPHPPTPSLQQGVAGAGTLGGLGMAVQARGAG